MEDKARQNRSWRLLKACELESLMNMISGNAALINAYGGKPASAFGLGGLLFYPFWMASYLEGFFIF